MNKYEKALKVFADRYILVPLEIFSDNPYKTLVATMMSARTNDDTTVVAAKRLFKKAPNIKALNKLEIFEIEKLIYPVGFYKTKAKHLKKLSTQILNDFEGSVPKTREELITLAGVGRKTANLVLNRAFGIPAIAVDIHVHRITNMMGWVHSKTPEQTEKELNKKLPKKYWSDVNKLIVSIGRQFRSKQKLEDFLKKYNLVEDTV